jgi:hypothetical protein
MAVAATASTVALRRQLSRTGSRRRDSDPFATSFPEKAEWMAKYDLDMLMLDGYGRTNAISMDSCHLLRDETCALLCHSHSQFLFQDMAVAEDTSVEGYALCVPHIGERSN